MKDKIIVAFDVNQQEDFLKLAMELKDTASFIKIGMECFYTLGPDSVRMAKDHGFKVFLDLKLHDIPNTVEKSCRAISKLGVDLINVHALGGLEMMKAARNGCDTKLIAVTHLTSLDQNSLGHELGIKKSIIDSTKNLAALAKEAGLDGVVSSAKEVKEIKKLCGNDFLSVTPGIRLDTDKIHDQKRVMTPSQAFKEGSDFLVIGRSITGSTSPVGTFNKILESIHD